MSENISGRLERRRIDCLCLSGAGVDKLPEEINCKKYLFLYDNYKNGYVAFLTAALGQKLYNGLVSCSQHLNNHLPNES